jgi:apolipoprotein N-acyltransferase
LAGGLAGRPALIGAADLVGVYGLTLLVAFSAISLAAIFDLRRAPRSVPGRLAAAIIVIAFQIGYGSGQYAKHEALQEAAPAKTVAVLQPSIPQDRKWDPRFRDEILGRLSSLMAEAEKADPWLVVWPETAAPFIYGLDPEETLWLDGVLETAAEKGLSMLVGLAALDYDEKGFRRLKNRAQLVGPEGFLGGYDKTHLVPFGEYVPLSEVLPILSWPFAQGLLGAVGRYSPGRARSNLSLDNTAFGVLICFESIFPYQARQRAEKGARFLVVTTNDAWFGLTAAPEQHLWQASMRSVETRLPLVRAANNGISALISPSGRILERSAQNEVGAYAWTLRLSKERPPTLMARGGWLLAPACGAAAAAAALWLLGRRLKASMAARAARKRRRKGA